MKTYISIRKKEGLSWDDVPSVELTERYRTTPDGIRARAQLIWSDDALCVRLRAAVPDIRAEERGELGMPCEDSCLEFFFCPVPGDARYFNVEFNFNGCVYLGFGTGLSDLVRLLPEGGAEAILCPEISRTGEGWEISYRVPLGFIRRFMPEARFTAGMQLSANFYACSDLSQPPYYLSWSPIEGEPFSYHRSECFGKLILSE